MHCSGGVISTCMSDRIDTCCLTLWAGQNKIIVASASGHGIAPVMAQLHVLHRLCQACHPISMFTTSRLAELQSRAMSCKCGSRSVNAVSHSLLPVKPLNTTPCSVQADSAAAGSRRAARAAAAARSAAGLIAAAAGRRCCCARGAAAAGARPRCGGGQAAPAAGWRVRVDAKHVMAAMHCTAEQLRVRPAHVVLSWCAADSEPVEAHLFARTAADGASQARFVSVCCLQQTACPGTLWCWQAGVRGVQAWHCFALMLHVCAVCSRGLV